MRIAHVTATFPPYQGGTGNVCFYNAVELGRRGHDVTVFTAAHPPGDYAYPPEITVRRLPVTFRIGNAPLLPGLLGIKDFDLIHLHYPFIFGAELVTFSAVVRRVPMLLTYHSDLIGAGVRKVIFDSYMALSPALVFQAARKICAVTEDHARHSHLKKLFYRHWDRVVVIPNAVDAQLYHPGEQGVVLRKQWGVPDETSLVLFVATLDSAHHYKGLESLLMVLANLSHCNFSLVIAGDGDRKKAYQEMAAQYGISARTRFLGNVPNRELPAVYQAADVFVLPSMAESFGIVAIEAMACGVPVIANNIPGIRSVVTDGSDGLLTRPGDLQDLAQKLEMLLSDSSMRKTMGQNGYQKVMQKYTWPKVVDRLEEVYRSVVEGRG